MRKPGARHIPLAATLFLSLLVGARNGWAQIKLHMKDGTYQLVKSYEVHGDRVRYYSVERSAWEEVPVSLVDFEATKRAQAEEEAAKKKELEETRELEKQRFELLPETGYEVAPGIHLPQEQGVFAFDGARVVRMIQSSAEVVSDKKRAALLLALPGPFLKNRALVVLPGAQAAIRFSAAQPVFFIQLNDTSGTGLELIPVKPGKEARLVEKIQVGMGIGKAGEVRAAIPLERSEVAPGVYKLRPTRPLAPGEYALGELVQQKLNLELWDFGIEGAPKGPRKAEARRPPPMSEETPEKNPPR